MARKNAMFEEVECASVVQQLVQALNYLHKNAIVHRDIKPDNIMFVSSRDMRIKLIDFGTSQKVNMDDYMTQTFGTPDYMAPEVISGCYNFKADLWSVGVVLHVMLTN